MSYWEQMQQEEEEAKKEYERLKEEDKNKNYLDLLPTEFKNFKRSVLKSSILKYIDKTTEFLNTCSLYEGKVFDKKDVVRYMMIETKYSNFYLAYQFIPRKDSMDIISERNRKEETVKQFYENHKDELKVYDDLSYHLQILKQVWEQYEDRQKVKKGELIDDWDMEKDGFPRTGRGSLCYLFIPVKNFPKDKTGNIILFNPRSKKNETFEILDFKKSDNIYSCLNEKKKKVFLTDYETVAEAWDCLFSSNKEIFSGWWNKIMIYKKETN